MPHGGIAGRLARCARVVATRFAWAGLFAALAAALAVAAAGFLIAACYLYLAAHLSHPVAALVVGALLLALAGLSMIAARSFVGRACRGDAGSAGAAAGERRRTAGATPVSSSELAASLGAAVGDEAARWTRARPFAATAAALVAGVVVGASPRVRGALENVLGGVSDRGGTGGS